jgi:hypothetical protein
MKIVFTRLFIIIGIASLAAVAFAYSAAQGGPQQFYSAAFWFASVLLLISTVWAFAPVSRRSSISHVASLFAAALSFLVVWVFSSQLSLHVLLLLRNAHAP